MCAQIKINALLINPDLEARMRLKQATTVVPSFGSVWQISTLNEANSRLNGSDRCDVAFIAYNRFAKDEVVSFIANSKKTKQGQDTTYILILGTAEQGSSIVAQNVMIGADGFLLEPYSVEALQDLVQLSVRVKKERSVARESAALRFLISDIMNQLDLVAYTMASGVKVSRSMKRLSELCTVLGTLQAQSLELYNKLVVEMFENAPLPKKAPPAKQYTGASTRVKKKLEEKMLNELEHEFTSKPSEHS